MQITSGKVVSIDYTLTNDKQQMIDSSEGAEPLTYLHGNGQIIFGLEKALNGKRVGDSLTVKVTPDEGYGLHDENKITIVPRSQLKGVGKLTEGMQLSSGEGPEGRVLTVTKIEEENVTLDANHPLAGENLNFEVVVRAIRPASEEEISHGHVHGPGGHHH